MVMVYFFQLEYTRDAIKNISLHGLEKSGLYSDIKRKLFKD